MRIVHVTPYYMPDTQFGGPVKLVAELAEQQASQGHAVTVLSYQHSDTAHDDGEITVHRFAPVSRWLSRRFNMYYSWQLNRAIANSIAAADVVHTHDFRSFHNIKLARICRATNTPLVMSSYKSINPNTGQAGLKRLFDILFGGYITKRVTHWVAVNSFEQADIEQYNVAPQNISIIPNCIKQEDTSSIPGVWRSQFGIGQEAQVVLFFARLHSYKRPDLVIEAWPKVVQAVPGATLVFYGPDGGEANTLRSRAHHLGVDESVRIIPEPAGDLKHAAYNESDLVVMPSPYNEFPLVLIEAMAHGVPVVTSEQSIANYIHNHSGRVVEPVAAEYSNTIIELLQKDTLLKTYGQNGTKIYQNNFTLDSYNRSLMTVYQNQL